MSRPSFSNGRASSQGGGQLDAFLTAVSPAGQASAPQAAPATEPPSHPTSEATVEAPVEDRWLSYLEMSCDGWLDTAPPSRATMLASRGVAADVAPSLAGSIDAYAASRTGRVVPAAQAMVPVRPASQASAGSTIAWGWIAVAAGAGVLAYLALQKK